MDCHECGHGINRHVAVETKYYDGCCTPCPCLKTPSDIAAHAVAEARREAFEEADKKAMEVSRKYMDNFDGKSVLPSAEGSPYYHGMADGAETVAIKLRALAEREQGDA